MHGRGHKLLLGREFDWQPVDNRISPGFSMEGALPFPPDRRMTTLAPSLFEGALNIVVAQMIGLTTDGQDKNQFRPNSHYDYNSNLNVTHWASISRDFREQNRQSGDTNKN